MRTLVVIRHAKAGPHLDPDDARPLVEKGHRQSASIGTFLLDAQIVPDAALVSSAARTRQTWESLSAAAGFAIEPQISDELYGAGPRSILRAVRSLADDTRTAVVVGHNPAMHDLAESLDAGQGDAAALADVRRSYPTGATSVFDVPGPWSELDFGAARITSFYAP